MLAPNQRTHKVVNGRIVSGQYRGMRMTAQSGNKEGWAWFQGGGDGGNWQYLKYDDSVAKPEPKPTVSGPAHAGPAVHAPAFDFSGLPAFPQMPKPPKPEVMPVPDDAKIRAEKERKMALARRGRTSTILSQNNMLN